jgi:hypothetical protein
MKPQTENRPTPASVNRFKKCAALRKKATLSADTPKLVRWQIDRYLMVTSLEVRHAQ